MKLKTYTSSTMAQALAMVRKDLGAQAVIVHTRSYRTGSWFGLGGRPVVEITASSDAPADSPRGSLGSTSQKKPLVDRRSGASDRAPGTRDATRDLARAALLNDAPCADRAPGPMQEHTPAMDAPRATASIPNGVQEGGGRAEAVVEGAPACVEPEPGPPEPMGVIETTIESKVDALEAMMARILEGVRAGEPPTGVGSGAAGAEHDALSRLRVSLEENDVPREVSERVALDVRTRLDADSLNDGSRVERAVLERLASMIRVAPSIACGADAPRGVVALIGPTGVGKTTTVAKLAARAKLRDRRCVGLVTSDTYRIGAVEQLRTYADIVGLTLKIANTPEQMRRAIEELASCDLIVLDTAGRSQHNTARLDELRGLLAAADPAETHLVCSSTVSARVLASSAERFMALEPDRVILTKLDECVTTGVLARIGDLVGLPISFVTHGQEVPDDLVAANAEDLARRILEGPGS